jgi:hypothetical protein
VASEKSGYDGWVTDDDLRQTVPLGKMLGWKNPGGNWPVETTAVRGRSEQGDEWTPTFRWPERVILSEKGGKMSINRVKKRKGRKDVN